MRDSQNRLASYSTFKFFALARYTKYLKKYPNTSPKNTKTAGNSEYQ